MLAAAARTPKVVQTLAEALINYRTANGELKEQAMSHWETCFVGSARERRVRIESKVRGK